MGNIFTKRSVYYYSLSVSPLVGNGDRKVEQLYYSGIADTNILELYIVFGHPSFTPMALDCYHGYLKSTVAIHSRHLKPVSAREYQRVKEIASRVETKTRTFGFIR